MCLFLPEARKVPVVEYLNSMAPRHIIILLLVLTGYTEWALMCTYPTDWKDGTWADSESRSSITFTDNGMQNYVVTYRGGQFSSWDCFLRDGELLLSRSTEGNVAGDVYYLYACMLINRVSSSKYYYHMMHGQDFNANPYRITAKPATYSVNNTCDICAQNAASVSLSASEFIVMTNDGSSTETGMITSPSFAANPCDPSNTPITTTSTTTSKAPSTTTTPSTSTTTTTTLAPTTTTPTLTTASTPVPTTTLTLTTTSTPVPTTTPTLTTNSTPDPTTTTTAALTTTSIPTSATTTTPAPTSIMTTPSQTTFTTTSTAAGTSSVLTTTSPISSSSRTTSDLSTNTTTASATTPQATTTTLMSSPLKKTLMAESPWKQYGQIGITFSSLRMTGMSINIEGSNQTNWREVKENTNLLLYRSDRLFTVDNKLQYGYLCMVFSEINTNYMVYYLWSERDEIYSKERMHFSTDASADIVDCCCPINDMPSKFEYRVLYKSGTPEPMVNNTQIPQGTLPKCNTVHRSLVLPVTLSIVAALIVIGAIIVTHTLCCENGNGKDSGSRSHCQYSNSRSNSTRQYGRKETSF